MSKIVQLEDRYKEKVYPVAGGALEDSITAGMIADPVPIIGEDHSATPAAQFVATGNIQGGAVTTAKLANGAVTSDKIDAMSVFEGLLDGLGTRTEWSSVIESNTKIQHTRNSGFIQFRCKFSSTSGYAVVVIYGEDATTPKFGQQVACGPQQGYNQDSAIFPIKTGWYYMVTTSNASAKVSFTSFTS